MTARVPGPGAVVGEVWIEGAWTARSAVSRSASRPEEFPWPARPPAPGWPGESWVPGWPGAPSPGGAGPVPPSRVWLDPHAQWQDQLYAQLLEKRIVMASGVLDDEAATRLSAQLLTLDAENDQPIRLEMQNLRAELSAAMALTGVLDSMRAPVRAHVSGEIAGPALAVLAACPRRIAYPNAAFALSEPRLEFSGTATAVSDREQQARRMLDSLYYRLAGATGRDADEIREDARRRRVLTTAEAIGYGLIHARAGRE